MIIRTESTDDHGVIREILIAAFADHPYSKQTEHLVVEALRASGALTVSLVAELDGKVVGHIAFSPIKVNDRECSWFALGPVSVLPGFQGRGIGSELIITGLAEIKGVGAQGCVLVGYPAYYSRFGFGQIPVIFFEGVPPEFFLCLPMNGPLPQGPVSHHPAFAVSA